MYFPENFSTITHLQNILDFFWKSKTNKSIKYNGYQQRGVGAIAWP